ncbi:hypothetical protein KAH81_03560 [bacterium]|nr:hypothetical protein [bacterium]
MKSNNIIKLLFLLIIAFNITSAKVMEPIDSMRDAIKFIWLQPSEPFMMGETMFFEVYAENIATDSAVVYDLDPASVRMDSIEPFVMVRAYEQHPYDTLAPGDTVHYRYILSDGPNWLYDPYREIRSYASEVGLSCIPSGEYHLVYRKRWSESDSISFIIVEPPETERALVDSLAEMYVAYQVGRKEDAVALGFKLAEMSTGSPYTARGLIFARGVAWEINDCKNALTLDSMFWDYFGEPSVRYRFLPHPGILRATAGILGKCAGKTEQLNYIDRLANRFGDAKLKKELDYYRNAFQGKVECPTCPK